MTHLLPSNIESVSTINPDDIFTRDMADKVRPLSQLPATAISINDAWGYYTSTDVEGALQEIGSGAVWGGGLNIVYNSVYTTLNSTANANQTVTSSTYNPTTDEHIMVKMAMSSGDVNGGWSTTVQYSLNWTTGRTTMASFSVGWFGVDSYSACFLLKAGLFYRSISSMAFTWGSSVTLLTSTSI